MGEELKLDVVNLKYIGAAIDQSVKDLELIKTFAIKPDEVSGVIADLKAVELKVSALCRQSWFRQFEI